MSSSHHVDNGKLNKHILKADVNTVQKCIWIDTVMCWTNYILGNCLILLFETLVPFIWKQ